MPDATPIALRPCSASADYDRYLAAHARAGRTHGRILFALYAFHYEVAKTAESVREPIAAAIRLQWWREAIERSSTPARHRAEPDPALPWARRLPRTGLPRALCSTALIDARENDLEESALRRLASEWEAYADATSGNAHAAGGAHSWARATVWTEPRVGAGIAYALSGLLRALPFHAARRASDAAARCRGYSCRLVGWKKFSPAGPMPRRIAVLVRALADAAHRSHLQRAARCRSRRAVSLPALLPAGSGAALFRAHDCGRALTRFAAIPPDVAVPPPPARDAARP